MIPVNKLIPVFKNVIGWPYASPGSNNANGCDCSGAFVYAYGQFRQKIYHGSNRMIRVFCRDVRRVTSASQLQVGMAIFKARTDTSGMNASYLPGGQYYNPSLPYDYYHVGLVTSVNPLQIVNATTPVARVDTVLSKWHSAGLLNAVDYSGSLPPKPPVNPACPACPTCPLCPTDPTSPPVNVTSATVFAATGSTVNLRSEPSPKAVVLVRVPVGQQVSVLSQTNADWWRVKYQSTVGSMMSKFLRPLG
ncbi:MAG: SH3 domain-containing protein [Clostridia bacterium]